MGPIEVECDHLIRVDWLKQCVLVFNDRDEAAKELGRLQGIEDADVVSGTEALSGLQESGGGAGYATNELDGAGLFWMIFPGGNPSVGTIAHEVTHIVDYLCEYVGIPISTENSEVRCYLIGWMVGETVRRYEGER